MKQTYEPGGVIPACLLPFDQDLAIDERAYRGHLEDLLAVRGITAITTNAHASEVHALTFDEQRRVLAVTREVLGDRVATVISGLPMVRMPLEVKRAIVDQALGVMPEGHAMLQYTYSPLSPVPVEAFGLEARLARYVVRNFPPAAVWAYRRKA